MLKSKVLRGNKTINHHIYSSLWSSVKSEINTLNDNCGWIIGNGENINFWFPILRQIVTQVTIPRVPKEDKLIWIGCSSGELTLKEAFKFKYGTGQNLQWAKEVWCTNIPPSKSLMTWRLIHNKLPTDDNLLLIGCNLPSMCSSCQSFTENTFHLFFECSFATQMWNWLASLINKHLQFNSSHDIWSILNYGWSPQCRIVIKACIINLINVILYRRNQIRFQDKVINCNTAINIIISKVSLSGNLTTKSAAVNMQEFIIMKSCKVNIRPPKAPAIKEVIWTPPMHSWIKINTDGAAIKKPTRAAAGGIFRNSDGIC